MRANDREKTELIRKNDELSEQVKSLTDEVDQLSERLRLEMAERSQLARNLHDAVNQSLFSAGLIAEVLPRLWERDPAAARHSLEDLRRLTFGALAEIRVLLAESRPLSLAETDFGDLLRLLGHVLAGRMNIPVRIRILGKAILPTDVQVTLYYLSRDYLQMLAREARASRVDIILWQKSKGIILGILDENGRQPAHSQVSFRQVMRSSVLGNAERSGVHLSRSSRPFSGNKMTFCWQKGGAEGVVKE